MNEIATSLFLIIGALFMLLAALGLARFPDLFMRLQATTKASTLGIFSLLMAAATHFQDVDVTARSLLILAFVFITAPAGAHAIARAAHLSGVPMWKQTSRDELAEAREREGWHCPEDAEP